MKPADTKSKTYINFNKESNYKNPKFDVGDYVRISKSRIIFEKDYSPNCFEQTFVVKKVKDTVLYTYFTGDLKGNYCSFLGKRVT